MTAASPCPDSPDLARILHGPASAWEVERLARHLEECNTCADAVDQLLDQETLVDALRVALRNPAGSSPRGEEATVKRLVSNLRELRPAHTPLSGERSAPFQTACGSADSSAKSRGASTEPIDAVLDVLAPPEEPDELGRIGPYGVLRPLGHGGMGTVFAARQMQPRRLVALKVILSGPHSGRERLARFHGEIETIARLQHPNIVQVHEVGEHQGRPYFTMEYLEGGTLAQKLAAAPLPARAAAEVVEALARAVHFAHGRGFIHRDLKPANVLLKADGTPKISDFGLAKQLDSDTEDPTRPYRTASGAIVGTPAYMAPEQALGRREVGPAADVYALGVILYEALTSRPPFQAATVLEVLEQVCSQEPVPPTRLQPGLPRDLQTICLKCLHKDPRRRYGSAAALADDLNRFLAGKPISARPVRSWERAWKWARRKPAAAALLTVTLLAVVGLIAGVLVHNTQLQQAAQEARHQQELARAHYRRARDTLAQMLKQFDGLHLGEVPQLKELQRKQLEMALTFYEGALGDQDDPDPAIQMDSAVACQQAAGIQAMLGRREAAAQNYGRAIKLLEGLPPEQGDAKERQRVLAACHNGRGMLAISARRWAEGEQDIRKALAIYEALAQTSSRDLIIRTGLADTEHCLGSMYQLSGKPAESEPHYLRAVKLYRELIADEPKVEGYQDRLASEYVNLALIYQTSRRATEAIEAYRQAEKLLLPLVERRPAGSEAVTLAAVCVNWGLLYQRPGKFPEALARHTRAVELLEAVLEKEPQHNSARAHAFSAHGARAQDFEALGRWAEAASDWDRVITLDRDRGPRAWGRRVVRAMTLGKAGMHARVASEAAELAKDPRAHAEGLRYLASAYTLAAKAVPTDKKLPTAEQAALAERYCAAALALLQRIQERGYFQNADHARRLAADADLQPLRGRPAFQKLLRQVKSGK